MGVENESEKVISALVGAGADLNVVDYAGNTPLHLAASKSVMVVQVREGQLCLDDAVLTI